MRQRRLKKKKEKRKEGMETRREEGNNNDDNGGSMHLTVSTPSKVRVEDLPRTIQGGLDKPKARP